MNRTFRVVMLAGYSDWNSSLRYGHTVIDQHFQLRKYHPNCVYYVEWD